ncbi:hypothetical protein [Mesorhizobium sp. YR577]|uniref:hypothetical protein n=1 Tax=Mesorhizobium sp. YR577 TaxID=1884373 RepID=UPI0008E75460|nr:hypothetical protein [Mesorhizobium sp. YR577]SFU23039.1 hypothetical protein SAMN05518861_14611 [Mesorhizobium sp. YR577]
MPVLAHFLVLAAIVVVVTPFALLLRLSKPVVSDVFSLQAIPFWQAHKLLLIAGILFGPLLVIGHTSDRQSAATSRSEDES